LWRTGPWQCLRLGRTGWRHGEHGLPEGGRRRPERDGGLGRVHLLAGDPARAVGAYAVAVHPDRSAELQRHQLAARDRRDSAQVL